MTSKESKIDNIFHALYLSLLLMMSVGALMSCSKEISQRRWVDDEVTHEVLLTFYGAHPGDAYQSSTLKANEMGDGEEESEIGSLLLLYNEEGSNELNKKLLDYSSTSLVAGLFSTRLDLTKGTYTFYAIANPSASLITALNGVTNMTSLHDLIVSDSESDAFKAPLMMFGRSEALEITSEKRIGIRMTRLAARVEVRDETEGRQFEILSVQMFNRPLQSYLIPRVTTEDNLPILPSPLSRGNSAEVVKDANGLFPPLYTFEAVDHDANDDNAPVYLIIKAKYKGVKGYYRVDITDFRGRQTVRRGGKYIMSLKNVKGYGYETLEEAQSNNAANLIFGISEDGDGVIGSDDWNYQYVLYDGEYFIALSNERIRLIHEGGSYKFYIKSNAPLDPVFGFNWDLTDVTYPPGEEPWLSTGMFYDVETGEEWIRLDFSPLQSNLGPSRSATLKIWVLGRPNLSIDIPVTQEPQQSFFNNLDVEPSLFVSIGNKHQVYASQVATTFTDCQWYVKRVYDSKGVENPEWFTYNISKPPLYHHNYLDLDIYQSDAQIVFSVDPLPVGVFYREGYLLLSTLPYDPSFPPRTKIIKIVNGAGLDYNIEYAGNDPRKVYVERRKDVIESSLHQTASQIYKVNVISSKKWVVKKSHDWITVTQPEFASGSYNDSFTVTLPHNTTGENIGGIYQAREGYVDIVGEEITERIMVYQGGYVKIGQYIWMDRNLQKTRFPTNSSNVYEYKNNRNSYRISKQVFYDSAIPIGHPGDVPVNYAWGTNPPANRSGYFGDVVNDVAVMDRFSERSQQYTFSGTNAEKVEHDDGYFGWGAPGTLVHNKNSSNNTVRYQKAWNAYYNPSSAANVMKYAVSKGTQDPCPEGWRVPSYAELFDLEQHLATAKRYNSGVKDRQTVLKEKDINNGLYFYNDDKVSCWFPFTGFREEVGNGGFDIIQEGNQFSYYANFCYDNKNAHKLTVEYGKTFIEIWNGNYMLPIRCVKDTTIL